MKFLVYGLSLLMLLLSVAAIAIPDTEEDKMLDNGPDVDFNDLGPDFSF